MSIPPHRRVFKEHYDTVDLQCYFCSKQVIFDECHIHHIDHNHDNNDPKNLSAAHPKCHREYHLTGRTVSTETRAKLSVRLMGHPPLPPETLRAIGQKNSVALTGRIKSPETCAAISASRTPEVRARISKGVKKTLWSRVTCPSCGLETYPGPLGGHRKATGH